VLTSDNSRNKNRDRAVRTFRMFAHDSHRLGGIVSARKKPSPHPDEVRRF
jgi:hypothetical protein